MHQQNSFEQAVQDHKKQHIFSDFFHFLKSNKKWWLLPFILVFFGLGLFVLLAGTGAAPFVYTFF
jgi:hypothetical protein